MGGGLLQLIANGSDENIYLNGNPQITYFKSIHKRHTNFSMESIKKLFNGSPEFGKKLTIKVDRSGDLLYKTYIQITLNQVNGKDFRWVNWIGHAIIKNIEILIGGKVIDRHYGEWLHIWNELSQTNELKEGYASMVGNIPILTMKTSKTPECVLYIPLQFWFCKNPGLALPMLSLQYTEVTINLELNERKLCCFQENVKNDDVKIKSVELCGDYIFLDTEERKLFSENDHEYLIEQLQFSGEEKLNTNVANIKLNFQHPVKELIWVVQKNTIYEANKQIFNFTDYPDSTYGTGKVMDPLGDGLISSIYNTANINTLDTNLFPNSNSSLNSWAEGLTTNLTLLENAVLKINENIDIFDKGKNPIIKAKLILNGHDRFIERGGRYFNLVQPYQSHTNIPQTGINVYSFALNPEKIEPSGTCNMSKLDSVNLIIKITNNTILDSSAKIKVYALNYNILKIANGIAGITYSN